ncbi:MAG TPA: DNA repair protein RecN [Alphaproteobacteria bacterium]|nr:DNA repair protein RecN [Alphaproteobacteria bacterium]USO04800.1 MAG: DNA repair protein RecN [Rhodospirillales bacterium]HOO82308.1 DNA repair protein RecN [Alphaproteobacteria bacterium]
MLASLRIQNVVLIESLNIEFQPGLCALTGETGAGKSILLDSLGLALGARADSTLVRKGADQATVIAVFEVPLSHPSLLILHNVNIGIEDGMALSSLRGGEADEAIQKTEMTGDFGSPRRLPAARDDQIIEIIIRRTLSTDGRSKAYINDQPVSAGLLREIAQSLIEIHGQFDTQGLLNPSTHRKMLDDYAGADNTLAGLWKNWQERKMALADLKSTAEASRAEEDFLRTALEDLDALEPKAGEEDELAALRERLMHREQVMEGLNAAYEALSGENDPVRSAWATLERIADKIGPQGHEAIGALDRASSEIAEALSEIQRLSADLEQSEHDLQTIDDRLFDLRAQARKHVCSVNDLPAKREELAGRLNAIEHADEALAEAVKQVEAARGSYINAAQKLSDLRTKTARRLDDLVAKELPPLKLEKARFVTRIEPLGESEWGPGGIDRVRFLVTTNPGSDPGPLEKIASGGEMARFMLALKVVMAQVGSAGSLIFDEVDAGIGGATADAVGERLARLAAGKQVMVVTHAPQVAARAAHHWIVKKEGAQDIKTTVTALATGQPRREEIARMLAGAVVTEEARAAAEKLLEAKVA